MTQIPKVQSDVDTDAPLTNFSHCHEGIVSHLNALGKLPPLYEAAVQAHALAQHSLAFFSAVIFEHHSEEERELFPAVLKSAAAGEEHDRVQVMVERLTAEHRHLEHLWKDIEPALKDIVKGKQAHLPEGGIESLVRLYLAHAHFEEQEFLPLSETILARNSNHMAALGLSLHMRHMPPAVGYV